MGRSNEAWLMQLTSDGPVQQAALSDLRDALMGGLRHALADYARADGAFLEDTVQDALLRILERLDQFEGRSRFVTWASAIAIRLAFSELRRRRWKDVSLDEITAEGDAFPPVDVDSTWVTLPQRQAILDKMYDVIRHDLTLKQRTVLHAELKGMPQAEIARHLGSNRNAIYKLTHDARKRLKHGLESAGYRLDDVRAAFSN